VGRCRASPGLEETQRVKQDHSSSERSRLTHSLLAVTFRAFDRRNLCPGPASAPNRGAHVDPDHQTQRALHTKLERLTRLIQDAHLRLERVFVLRGRFEGQPHRLELEATIVGLEQHLSDLRRQHGEVLRSLAPASSGLRSRTRGDSHEHL
jgi:hypothetical protein